MRKIFLTSVAVIASSFFLAGCLPQQGSVDTVVDNIAQEDTSPTEQLPFTASFEIYTRGTKRTFTQAMYHNQAEEVYIDASDPNQVRVERSGITWQEFFNTLPFSLDKECLITGTGQTFCSNDVEQLRFFINGQENPKALDREIGPADQLRVEYGES